MFGLLANYWLEIAFWTLTTEYWSDAAADAKKTKKKKIKNKTNRRKKENKQIIYDEHAIGGLGLWL